MSINMYLSEVDSQTNSIASLCRNFIEEMEAFKQVIENFTSQNSLRGRAYQSAKTYFQSVYIPLANGVIMASETLVRVNERFPEAFRSQVDGNDVVEEQLINQINQLNSLIDSYTSIPNISPSISFMVTILRNTKTKIENKLERLYSFNSTSPSIFDEAETMLAQVEAGVNEISSGRAWNSSTNTFSINAINLDWARDLNQRWDERIDNLKAEALEYMHELEKKIPDVTQEDIERLLTMTQQCPDVDVPEALFDFIIEHGPDFGEQFLEHLQSSSITNSVGTVLEASGSQVKNIAYLVSYYSATWGPDRPNSFVMMSPEEANRTRRFATFGERITKFGRIGVPAIGGAIDFTTQLVQGEDVGDAAIKAGAHVAIGVASGKAGAAMGATIGTAIFPVGGTVAGAAIGFVIGVGLTAAGSAVFDVLYDNRDKIVEGFRTTVNCVTETLSNVGEEIGRRVRDVGNAVSDFFSGLGSVFGN